MLELAVSKATPSESASGYCLVLVTPQGGNVVSSACMQILVPALLGNHVAIRNVVNVCLIQS